MNNKAKCITVILLMIIAGTACQNHESGDSVKSEDSAVQTTEENEKTDSKELEEVTPEFDADGNPTGDYAKYLWDKQRMEEAQKSMAEEAMREYYEELYEENPNEFPL